MMTLMSYIDSAYGLGPFTQVSKIGGLSSKNYRLFDGKSTYILKKMQKQPSIIPKRIYEVSLTLRNAGLPAPIFLSTRTGEPFLKVNNSYYLLYKEIKGKHLHEADFNEKSLEQVGAVLSKFHQSTHPTCVDIVPPSLNVLSDLSFPLFFDLKSQLGIVDNKTREMEVVLKSLDEKENLLRSINFKNKSKKQDPYLVHGDFHNENLLFNTDHTLAGILDFERVHIGGGLQDVFHFIMLACCNSGFTDKNMGNARIFVNSYLRSLPHSKNDIENSYYAYIMEKAGSTFLEQLYITNKEPFVLDLIRRDLSAFKFLTESKEIFFKSIFD